MTFWAYQFRHTGDSCNDFIPRAPDNSANCFASCQNRIETSWPLHIRTFSKSWTRVHTG